MGEHVVGYVAVHGGAGVHRRESDKQLKHGLRAACQRALLYQHLDHSALDIVENAIGALEDDVNFNAGFGSNLTLDGEVECDASIMGGISQSFGSIGAAPGIKNPIRLARSVLEHSRTPRTMGRIPPLTLVGAGALKFAKSHCNNNIEVVPAEQLVSEKAREKWLRWKQVLDTPQQQASSEDISDVQDTVGAVAFHTTSGVAAGVSSGGLLLKYSGRIGQAAIFGAGCWAQHYNDDRKMACSISGAGEDIIRSCLARELGKVLDSDAEDVDVHECLRQVIVEKFWKPHRDRGEESPNVGILMLTTERDEETEQTRVRLWCAFTTASMAIAYASTLNPEPKVIILRRPAELEARPHGEPRIYITSVSL